MFYVYVAEKCLLATLRVYLRASVILLKRELRENAVDDLVQAGTSLQLHTFVLYVLLFGCLNTLVCKAKV